MASLSLWIRLPQARDLTLSSSRLGTRLSQALDSSASDSGLDSPKLGNLLSQPRDSFATGFGISLPQASDSTFPGLGLDSPILGTRLFHPRNSSSLVSGLHSLNLGIRLPQPRDFTLSALRPRYAFCGCPVVLV